MRANWEVFFYLQWIFICWCLNLIRPLLSRIIKKHHHTTFNLSSIFIFLSRAHVRGGREGRWEFIKIYRVSMYVCISDWGQSVIRDEMRFYGWWNVSQKHTSMRAEPTHQKARMRIIFHWYVNNNRSLHCISTRWALKDDDDDDSEVCVYVFLCFFQFSLLPESVLLTNTESDVEYW